MRITIQTLAIINSFALGLMAFLTVFMYKQNIGLAEDIAETIIPIALIGSLIFKFIKKSKLRLILSAIFDFTLIVYLYGITNYNSLSEFGLSLLSFNVHSVFFFYGFLIIYYVYYFRQLKKHIYNHIH